LQVSSIKLAQIPRNALLYLRKAALHLRPREVLVAIVNSFELAAVNGNARRRQQAQPSAKRDKPRTYLADRNAAILVVL
jgi:hypothetical protein